MDKVKKWEMKHHPKRVSTAPTGFFASLFGTKTPEPPPSRPASAPVGDGEKLAPKTELDPDQISRVTEGTLFYLYYLRYLVSSDSIYLLLLILNMLGYTHN